MRAILSRLAKSNRFTREVKASVDYSIKQQYLRRGRIPWTPGYSKYKNQQLIDTLADERLMGIFACGDRLPDGYGARLDERVVECPWTVAHLRDGDGLILDAGSVLNSPIFLERPELRDRRVVVFSLVLDWLHLHPNVSYVHGDFREAFFREELFDSIVCISTLEHVGMWPIPTPPFEESLAKPQPTIDYKAYRGVLQTFRSLLKRGGKLLLTVPFGRYEDHRWLQQFDQDGIADIVRSFEGECRTQTYYRHEADGWQVARPEDCAQCEYHNLVTMPEFGPDLAAAARAVACLELVRLDGHD
jgi:hypothetical protein